MLFRSALAGLDIAESRLPQDGRLRIRVDGREIDVRVSTFPTLYGEDLVLRLLDRARVPLRLEELGLSAEQVRLFRAVLRRPHGLILITGPTGSGKTTTLYAALAELNTVERSIFTLEDPVEYELPGVRQSQINVRAGFGFASGLRALLRHDPDVILVGEMRDRETVEIGLSAAETGHLVLTTLHTTDAGSTVNRILGMFPNEDERQIRIRLADALRWIVCQRLLPKIGGGRVATFEILCTNLRVKDAILNGEAEGRTFYDIMETGTAFGMTTFDQHLIALFEQESITQETAMAYASHRGVMGRGIDMIKSARGEATTDIGKLEIDKTYSRMI